MDKDELWLQARTTLLAGAGPNDIKSVFLNMLSPMGVFGTTIVLIAQDPQVEEWVKANYVPEMEAALQQVAGQHLTVAIGSPNDGPVPTPAADSSPEQQFPTQLPQQPSQTAPAEPAWLNARVSPSDISHTQPVTAAYQPGVSIPIAQPQSNTETHNEALFSKCTFDTFVVGRSNEFARGAALAVAEQPGVAYNPLFIYGSSGLGKTHLLVAIANYARQNFPTLRTLYVPANDFLNDYVSATQKNQWNAFNEKYHEVDILLIDDVQYLENKEETINQFFNIFNAMTNRNNQVVLSADRAPRDINMDERMRSRFNSGLLADIKPPDYETRLAILKNYMNRVNSQTNFYGLIPDDVLEYLAETSTSNIREIEGAVTRLISNMSLLKKESITVEEARELLQDFFPDIQNKQVEIPTIMSVVEHFYGVSHEDMVSMRRHKGITNARHVAIYLSRYLTEESLEAIGKKFGGRDHTTVMHSVSKIEKEQKTNRVLFDQLEQLTKMVKERS